MMIIMIAPVIQKEIVLRHAWWGRLFRKVVFRFVPPFRFVFRSLTCSFVVTRFQDEISLSILFADEGMLVVCT